MNSNSEINASIEYLKNALELGVLNIKPKQIDTNIIYRFINKKNNNFKNMIAVKYLK